MASAAGLAIRPQPGDPYRITAPNLPFAIHAMAAVRPGVLAIAAMGGGSRLPLHLVDSTGHFLGSFGETVERPDLRSARGVLLWSTDLHNLLFFPAALPEIQFYDGRGNALMVKGLGLNRPLAAQWRESQPDQLSAAALLPHGEVLCQMRYASSERTELLLLDRDFNLVPGEVRSNFGRLQGADAQGGVYLLRGNRLTRARVTVKTRPSPDLIVPVNAKRPEAPRAPGQLPLISRPTV